MRCPKCRTLSSADHSYCHGCGRRLFAWLGDPFGTLEPANDHGPPPPVVPRAASSAGTLSSEAVQGPAAVSAGFPWGKAAIAGGMLLGMFLNPYSGMAAVVTGILLMYALSRWRRITWWTFFLLLATAIAVPIVVLGQVSQRSSQTAGYRAPAPTARPGTATASTGGSISRPQATPLPTTNPHAAPRETLTPAAANANALASSYAPIFGPTAGRIEHQPGGPTSTARAPVGIRDLTAEVRFFNPPGNTNGEWDCGFFFRHNDPDDNFQLFIDQSWRWRLILSRGTGVSDRPAGQSLIAGGMFPSIDVTPNGFNDLRVVAQGEDGFFFVNGRFVSYLRLHDWVKEGDVMLGTGFVSDRQVAGGATRYENFVVSSPR